MQCSTRISEHVTNSPPLPHQRITGGNSSINMKLFKKKKRLFLCIGFASSLTKLESNKQAKPTHFLQNGLPITH